MSHRQYNSRHRTTRLSCESLCRTIAFGMPARIWIRHRRIVGETPSSWRQTRHDTIEEPVTELAYPGTTSPSVIEKV
jgi:hypothetical protein